MTRREVVAVLERVKTWPEDRQADAAAMLLALEEHGTAVYVLDGDERADIEEALEEDRRGAVASDDDVAAVFDRLSRKE